MMAGAPTFRLIYPTNFSEAHAKSVVQPKAKAAMLLRNYAAERSEMTRQRHSVIDDFQFLG